MTKFFNPNPIGFLDSDINQIPDNAVEITDEEWKALLEAEAKGKIIQANPKGYPEAVNPPAPTKEQTIEIYNGAVRNQLDKVAQQWGYSSILSAVSYIGSTNIQYKADAEALSTWRDAYWTKAYQIEAGKLPDTVDAFLALLPSAPDQPKA